MKFGDVFKKPIASLIFRAAQIYFRQRLAYTAGRIKYWQHATGLLPPEYRGFVPRVDGDERPAKLDPNYEKYMKRMTREMLNAAPIKKEEDLPYPRKPSWGISAMPDDSSPAWHNLVRAYEEDR